MLGNWAMVVSTWMRRALARGHDLCADEYATGSTVPGPGLKRGPWQAAALDEPFAQAPEEYVRYAKPERRVASADWIRLAVVRGAPVGMSPVGTWREGHSIA
jgi:hypothetical protein